MATPDLNIWKHGHPNTTVAGWGNIRESGPQSLIMKAVSLPVVPNNKCKNAFDFIQIGHLCAGYYEEGGKDSCQGDSGGPLWWKDKFTQEIYQVLLRTGCFFLCY